MSLREQLSNNDTPARLFGSAATLMHGIEERAFAELKGRIHGALLDRIDLKAVDSLTRPQFREELKLLIDELLDTENVVINELERRNLARDIEHEMRGLGPIELLMADPTISDILVNTSKKVYIERFGKLEATDDLLSRRRPPDENHRQDRVASGPPRR